MWLRKGRWIWEEMGDGIKGNSPRINKNTFNVTLPSVVRGAFYCYPWKLDRYIQVVLDNQEVRFQIQNNLLNCL